ncbi:CRP-like cAMP-binding protein [Tenacibaculum adriaticum]|uniref:CRP-like cAMP-binding protein n=1 Tax=Tenacibaculum adriaticum TaxID=413713 RepID=A0A5S5DP73_9FLAO|nr:Crp/Fnr family transcriptional regulator [Tenacibaculum adriaticum]TYP96499.1 CRP-like cAMP-binding protein [Tenacibaculum adriaticum]
MDNITETFLKNNLSDISDKSIALFKTLMGYKKYSKGDIILDYGKPTSKFYILKSGLVGSFIKNDEGNEFIRTLYTPNKSLGSLSALIKKKGSNARYACLIDCEIVEGDFYKFRKLANKNLELSLMYNNVLEQVYLRSEKKIDELSLLNASQRYLILKEDIPNIDNLLPQYQIANYLNITPVQLSRIRKKMFSE